MINHNVLPRHLADFLGTKDGVESVIQECQKTSNINEINTVINRTLFDIIKPFYDSRDIDISIDAVMSFIRDPLKNANNYVWNSKPIIFGVFMSDTGLVTSYNDGSEYFKNQNVKRSWESKTPYHERYANNNTEKEGLGSSRIYTRADIIFVDTSEGTLYAGLKIGNTV